MWKSLKYNFRLDMELVGRIFARKLSNLNKEGTSMLK